MDTHPGSPPATPPIALDRTRQAAPQVFEWLRAEILSLRFAPGAVLSRTALQREFGLSQTPIRDALTRLAEEGLVEVFPQHATRVSRIDLGVARQAHFLRMAIELEAIRTIAEGPSDAVLGQLRAAAAVQERLLADGDYEGFLASDQVFHQAFYVTAGIPDLWAIVRRQSGHIDRLRRLNLPDPGKAEAIVRDHRRILDALVRRDPAAAQAALRDHLSGTLMIVERIRARYPGYITG